MELNQLSITDQNLMDIVEHGSSGFPIQYYVDELYRYKNQMIPLHWHLDLEFYVAYGGSIQIQIGKIIIDLEEGDGIFINSNVLHSFKQIEKQEKCECPNIVFSHELIASSTSHIYKEYMQQIIMDNELPYFILNKNCLWHKEILLLLDKVFSLLQKYGVLPNYYGQFSILPFQNKNIESTCFEMETQYCMNKIWQILYNHLKDIPKVYIEKSKSLLQIRTQKMLQYIHENYHLPISLNDISNAAHISKSEASRCFQSYLHTSPVNYLLNYRLEKAKYALQQSDDTIVEIAERTGFQSTSYFGKIFRRETKMTASEYRFRSRK